MQSIRNSFINLADPIVFASFGGEDFWEKIEVPAGTKIVSEGEDTQDFYYILSGTLEVFKSLEGAQNAEKSLAKLKDGDIFGEGSLLSDKGRTASVRAFSDSVLLKLTRAKFEKMIKTDPESAVGISLGIVKVQGKRLGVMNSRLMAFYRVSKISKMNNGDSAKTLSAIISEVKTLFAGEYFIFGMDGLPKFQDGQNNLEAVQMKIPDYANRFTLADAPEFFADDKLLFFPIHDLNMSLKGVFALALEESAEEEDIKFISSITELLSFVFDLK